MTSESAKPNTRRQDLGEVINKTFDRKWLLEFAETVKGMTQGVWGQGRCPECDSPRKVLVQIPDVQGQIKAVVALLEQAEGRPGTAQGEAGGVTLIVERSWPVGPEDQDKLPTPAPAESLPPIKS